MLRNLLQLQSKCFPLFITQNFKTSDYIRRSTRTFLSDNKGVKDFVALLGPEERQLLYQELHQLKQTSDLNLSHTIDETIVEPPNFSQLKRVFLHQALPFIGFGFLDNLIMIVAGDYIDTTIGVTLGISTMAAAGLGNALSDIAGIGSAWYVEKMATKIGVEEPKMSLTQAQMTRTRWSVQLGRIVGITIGCLLGMVPLLWLPTKSKEKK